MRKWISRTESNLENHILELGDKNRLANLLITAGIVYGEDY